MADRLRPRFHLKPASAAVLGALAALSVNSAFAQTAQNSAPATQSLPDVQVQSATDNSFKPELSTVGSKGAPQALRDIPQSVTVIPRAVMDSQAATSLSDVLRNVPGITMGAAEGGTIGNNINLRGFSARTDLYLDGVRDRGQYYRDVFSLDSIEVLKGPSSMLFGRGSTGGVINQVSKLPMLKDAGEINLTVGTNKSARTTGDFNYKLSDTSAARVAIMAQDVNSTRDVMENRDFGIAPSLSVGIGTPTEITLSALLSHNHDMADYGLPPLNGKPAPVNPNNFYGVNDDRTVSDVYNFNARIKHKFNQNWAVRNQTSFSRYNIDVRESGPNSVGTRSLAGVYTALPAAYAGAGLTTGNNTGNVTNIPISSLFVQLGSHDRKIEDQSVYNTLDILGEFETGALKHQLTVGVELGRDTYSNQTVTRTLPVVSLTDPTYGPTPGNSVLATTNLATASANTFAPYINDNITINPQWKLTAGVRHDTFKARIDNTIPSATTLATASQTATFTSVRTGLIYQPTDAQSYYVSYGTSFNPSLEQLTATLGQQDLPPETNKSYEAGAKWDLFKGDLSLTTAVFDVEKDNARQLVSTGVYALSGDIRVKGIEFGAAGRITKQWQVFSGVALMRPRIIKAVDGTQGNIPANTPQLSASLWTTYLFTRQWEIGGGATYMGKRFIANNNTVQVPKYLRFDAMAAYHMNKNWDFRVNLLNVADRKDAYDALIPSDGGRAVPTIRRTLLGTVSYRF